MSKQYGIELVWNREFHWSSYGRVYLNKAKAIRDAKAILNSGDGARVKSVRVIDTSNGELIYS